MWEKGEMEGEKEGKMKGGTTESSEMNERESTIKTSVMAVAIL